MQFRKNPFPRWPTDILLCLSIGVVLPILFLGQHLYHLSGIHEPHSLQYIMSLIIVMFLFINIETNLIACMVVDTSIDIRPQSDSDYKHLDWRYCQICDCLAPPRSWHCNLCRVCILKRDHHCGFFGCCIGHENHRYFICFLIYVFIGSFYCLLYLSYYIWLNDPLALIAETLGHAREFTRASFLLHLFLVTVVSTVFTFLLLMHCGIYVLGNTRLSDPKPIKLNEIPTNLRYVFGNRIYTALLFPLFSSPLPINGFAWINKQNDESK